MRKSMALNLCLQWTRSPSVAMGGEWLNLRLCGDVGTFTQFGPKLTRLWFQREIGAGSTVFVYEAKLDTCRKTSLSYAIKTVTKGTSTMAKARVFEKVKIYRRLEDVRVNEPNLHHVVMGCTKQMWVTYWWWSMLASLSSSSGLSLRTWIYRQMSR